MFFVRDSSSFQILHTGFPVSFHCCAPQFQRGYSLRLAQPFRSNEYIRKLFKRLRARLESGNNGLSEPIIDFAYGWVCEQEKASQPHYHCWIALPHRSVRWFGTPERGIAGIITEIWMKLTGGKATLVNLAKATKDYPDHYVIHRAHPSSLEGPVFWLSYLAKERGKAQTGKGTRMYSTSKLSSKVLNS